MKKTAYIWRESVYKNDFKCNKCGTKLAEPDGVTLVEESLEYSPTFNLFRCSKCHNVVGRIQEIEAPESITGKQGNFEDFINEQ